MTSGLNDRIRSLALAIWFAEKIIRAAVRADSLSPTFFAIKSSTS
jgi:hypothetical protein